MRVRSLCIVVAVGVAALLAPTSRAIASAPPSKARFIVTLLPGASPRGVASEYRQNGAEVDFVYNAALNGFAGAMSDGNLRALAGDRRVARVERDGVVTASAEQTGATWGLDRIDQRSGTNGTYTYNHNGSGVTAYIVDTGIRYSHGDFGGRAVQGYDAFGGNGSDCNGHGTHVAGTVAGATWGAAKAANLVAVRVLDCGGSGTWSGVIAGLDWIASTNAGKPAVANMSLGGGASSSVDDAVNRTIAAGVTVVVAAGNGNQAGVAQDACGSSPARTPAALTVGATTSTDAKTSWSNYGSCVDFFAPGASITSAWHTGDTATNTIGGTSMAAPHVAGVAALYLQQAPTATPATVAGALAAATTKGVVTSSSTANNHLLHSLVVAGATPPPPTSPTIGLVVTKGSKTKNATPVTATWTDSEGISGRRYDVWANGSLRAGGVAGPSHTSNWRGSGTVTYRVCRAGTTTICSPNVSITI